jgi:hypothetical protein
MDVSLLSILQRFRSTADGASQRECRHEVKIDDEEDMECGHIALLATLRLFRLLTRLRRAEFE